MWLNRFILWVFVEATIGFQSIAQTVKVLPGFISTDKTESSLTINSDSTELFFTRSESFYSPSQKVIYHSKRTARGWTEPKVAWFSGIYSDAYPFISYDNKYLYFTSTRPLTPDRPEKEDRDIWRIAKENGKWGEPEHLGNHINSEESEYSPSLDLEGNLYFGSLRDSLNWGNIFYAKKTSTGFEKPIALDFPVNTEDGEWGSCISKDGRWLVFESNGREENLSYDGDLFLAELTGNLKWTVQHLPINSLKSDLSPKFYYSTKGGLLLFFGSNRNEEFKDIDDVDIYQFSLKEHIK